MTLDDLPLDDLPLDDLPLGAALDGTDQVMICPGGPMLLRGVTNYTDDTGIAHSVERPVVAVCRCGYSGSLPWCDSTHKRLPRDKRPL